MKKGKRAVALTYDQEADEAPKIGAKGSGLMAEKIIAIAEENGIPVYPDKSLVATLEALDINMEIPEELYRAVAEVLVFICDIDKRPPTTP